MKVFLAILLPVLLVFGQELTEQQTQAGIEVRKRSMEAVQKRFPSIAISDMIEFYDENAADMLNEWRRRCIYQPDTASPYLLMLADKYAKIQALRKISPENYAFNVEQLRIEMQIRQLSFQIKDAQQENKSAAEIHELKTKLAELLKDSFAKIQQKQEQEVRVLENKLNELKTQVETRNRNKDIILQQKFKLLTGSDWIE